MSSGNMCHCGNYFLTGKYVGPTVSLGIVAGEGIPCERSPGNIPCRRGNVSPATPLPQPTNLFLDDMLDVPPRTPNPIPFQGHPSLDITLSISSLTHLDHLLELPSPPSPPSPPPPQPPIMGHPIYFNIFEYHVL
nr:hypothetical protein [Tanacetum cinerariifolium]